jgi:small subunit ribosomal protein S6
MALPPPVYDLVVLIDPAAEDSVRDRIVADVSKMISAGGEELRHDDWGERPMAYPIDHKTGAHYHLFQFHGQRQLLEQLQRTLRITDGVVRYRIIKLKPGTPDAPDMQPARREPDAAAAPTAAPAAAPDEAPPVEAGDAETAPEPATA